MSKQTPLQVAYEKFLEARNKWHADRQRPSRTPWAETPDQPSVAVWESLEAIGEVAASDAIEPFRHEKAAWFVGRLVEAERHPDQYDRIVTTLEALLQAEPLEEPLVETVPSLVELHRNIPYAADQLAKVCGVDLETAKAMFRGEITSLPDGHEWPQLRERKRLQTEWTEQWRRAASFWATRRKHYPETKLPTGETTKSPLAVIFQHA